MKINGSEVKAPSRAQKGANRTAPKTMVPQNQKGAKPMDAYTGETQRLDPPNNLTHQPTSNPLAAIHAITYRTWTLDAARRYLISARRLLEEYQRYQDVAAHYPAVQLPPEIAAILREVQR